MKNIVKKYEKILTYKNYSKRTIEVYSHYLNVALAELKTNPYQLTTKEISEYLISKKYSSISQQNQIIGCLKLFCKYVLNKKDLHLNKIERPKGNKKLPKVIESKYLIDSINKIENLKHKAILSLGYGCALRVSEVINLKIEDIDSSRMIIHIRNSKGSKDRIVPLSLSVLKLLRAYFCNYKPTTYLFNGQSNSKYTASSCNKLVKRYLGYDYHFHLLRHSSATFMLESGTELSIIQKILGHNNLKTTQIYTHISNNLMQTASLPL